MNYFSAYDSLHKFSPAEEIAHAYYKETGNYIDGNDLYFLLKSKAGYNFSRLGSEEHLEFIKKLKKHNTGSVFLTAESHIPDYSNINIRGIFRYIDICEHSHEFFEIVCVLNGKYIHSTNGKKVTVQAGDIVIIPPKTPHCIVTQDDTVGIVIQIRKDSFENVFQPLVRSGTTLAAFISNSLYSQKPCDTVTFHCGDDAFLYESLLYMYAQQKMKKHHYARVLDGLVLTFLAYLLQNYEDEIDFADDDDSSESRVIAIEKYLRHNFKTATLSDTAEHFGLNSAYLSGLIKEKTGYNFSYILRFLRMERAADLLQNTDMKIEQICDAVGYCDTTQFIKTFKKQYDMTPSAYRKSCRTNINP